MPDFVHCDELPLIRGEKRHPIQIESDVHLITGVGAVSIAYVNLVSGPLGRPSNEDLLAILSRL